ncbi:hypothetical protein [Pseudonocardia alni]|uniref:hypothetical protein n=1 Tax=Pseudonocardia alni TaxID=33907 RepID=UPI00247A1533|nr:hypothetical protein [Pseudonocardia alni]WFG47325.1 hypothetical protein PaSha_28135 [Pseudonocardia alni]
MSRMSARAGFIRIAARSQRTPRQNDGAVESATSIAASSGIVATRTRIAACRKIICRAKPIPAGMTPNSAARPRIIDRTLSSVSPRSGLSPTRAVTVSLARVAPKVPSPPSWDRKNVVSPSAAPSRTATMPEVSAIAIPNCRGPVNARNMPRPPRRATEISW